MVGAYYGVKTMDRYDLKEYVLKDIENYIRDFISVNPIDNFDYVNEVELVNKNASLITKLQDSLIILPRINADLDLILMIKSKIRDLKKEEYI